MMKTVVREHHWTPEIVNGLYLDDVDHFSLEFWYNDVVFVNNELNKKK